MKKKKKKMGMKNLVEFLYLKALMTLEAEVHRWAKSKRVDEIREGAIGMTSSKLSSLDSSVSF